MIGFVVGTVCLVALVKMARRGRCGYGHGYGGGCHGGGCHGGHGAGGPWERGGWGRHGHHHHHGPWGGGGGGGWGVRGWMLRHLFERLQATPGQERVIAQAVEEGREAMKAAWKQFRESRQEIGRSIAGEAFDETAMGGAFAKQDEAIQAARKAAMNALTKVHDALDPRQRAILGELIAEGPRGFGNGYGFGAPYNA